jgi:peptidoglycan/xylan/chitin deacetylase (PgdA/CDA1 family)
LTYWISLKKMTRTSHNPRKHKTSFYLLLLFIVLFAGILFFLSTKQVEAPLSDQSNKTAATSDSKPSDSGSITTEQTKLKDLSIPILMYHYIRVVDDPNDKSGIILSVTPDKFAQELDYLLGKGYKTITFKDVENGQIPDKPIILTFDDGYQDFYTNAYPLLKQRGLSAVVYIISEDLGNDYMTEEELIEISNNGIEIGSHTLSHPDLTTLSDEQAHFQIFDSKKQIEAIVNKNVISFCYPAGKYNDKIENMVKEAGYLYATTTKAGVAEFKTPFALSRHRMNSDTNISGYIK